MHRSRPLLCLAAGLGLLLSWSGTPAAHPPHAGSGSPCPPTTVTTPPAKVVVHVAPPEVVVQPPPCGAAPAPCTTCPHCQPSHHGGLLRRLCGHCQKAAPPPVVFTPPAPPPVFLAPAPSYAM